MKVPKPKKLPSGSWNIRLRLGGEGISITRSSETACKKEAQLVKAEYLAGKRIERIGELSEQALASVIRRYVEQNRATLSPSTIRGYESYMKSRFKDYQSMSLGEIDFQKMIDDELKKFSEKTVKNGWGLVHPALKFVGYPIPNVRLAKVPVKEIPFLQPEEILPFCEAVRGRPYEIAALIMLHGLRLSELKGLKWEDIDLKRGVINVRGAVVRGPDGYTDKETNKNETSTRPVPIMIPQLMDALNAVEDKQGAVDKHGSQTLLDDIKRACRRAGVTEVTNHGLRHSMASLCFHLKIPYKQIEQWGGWKDQDVLHRIYIRLSASSENEYKDAFQNFFSQKHPKKKVDENADGLKKTKQNRHK